MSNASPDAIVVGAGIVGAACAAALAREGLKVAVLDRDIAGGGATAAGMGHILVLDDSEEEYALSKYSLDLWRALAPELPARAEFDFTGTLWIAEDEEEMSLVRSKAAFARERGMRAEILDGQAVAEAEPNLRPGLAGGLLLPDDAVLYAPSATRWLLRSVVEKGGRLDEFTDVASVESGGVVLRDGTRLSAGTVVVATGAWARELFPSIPVKPRKGHLVITDRYPGFLRYEIVELGYIKKAHSAGTESVAFNVQPRTTGQVLIGSSRQLGVEHKETDWPVLHRMVARAVELMPGLARLKIVRTWTGFRAATDDHKPLIGPWPDLPGVLLATGHEGLGITTSLGTAELIASQVTGKPCPVPAEPFLPSRPDRSPSHG
jgi:glycine/D-amino acid oxidase-like deaminating enzyme